MSKTILITGGSRGIGKATTKMFLENGYKVISTSTTGDFEYEHENLVTYKYDQADSKSIKEFVNQLENEKYIIDVLINNAGIMLDWTSDSVKEDIFDKTITANLKGLITLTQKLLSLMSKNSLIINMSSSLGSFADELGTLAPAYSISKAGVNMYTKKLHAKISEDGLSVISYEPGWVKTDMGGEGAPREVNEPAEDLYKLATQDPKPKSGLFYNCEGIRDW